MRNETTLQHAWRAFWVLKKRRSEPLWARLIICSGLAMTVSFTLMILSGILTGRVADLRWWQVSLAPNLLLCLFMALAVLTLFRAVEWLLPAAILDRVASRTDWRLALALGVVGVLGIVLGYALGVSFEGWLYGFDSWGMAAHPLIQVRFYLFIAVIAAVNALGWRLRITQKSLQHQATESQLRLLQAQIEPHFLFNTLANVQSLMDYDPPRAKQMLGVFTDYLRISLGQLRHTESTLADELAMAQNYLQLLQIRMGERLSFIIKASDEAYGAVLPPLLLQPLIENAIHHGLEPKIEGGRVCVSARVNQGRLEICIDDDGLGSEAQRRPVRGGSGLALANIRVRLKTRYAENASLSLTLHPDGAQALLNLPYTATALPLHENHCTKTVA